MSVLLVGYAHGEGGITTHTHWLAYGLALRGHKVRVLSPHPPAGQPVSPWPDRGYAVHHYGGNGDALRGFAALGQERFDVAVVAGTGWKAMGGVLANRRIRRRIFFEVMSGDAIGRFDPRRLVHAGFDAVVSMALSIEQTFCRDFHWRGKRTIIPALPEPLEQIADIPERGPIDPPGKLRACYFGRLAAHKGASYLVEQWETLSAHIESLDIHGTGEEYAVIEGRIRDRGLGDRIRLHGRYPDGQGYVDLLRQYDVLLLPTTGQEGAPLVLLEAMACGTPFVVNGMGGAAHYANRDCRITSGDIAEFLPAVTDFAAAVAKGDIDGSRLQRHYHRVFSFEVLVGQWESYFDTLVRGRPESTRLMSKR